MQSRLYPLAAALVLLQCVTAKPTLGEVSRPNFVVILIDDLRYDTFGFMDHPFIETPALDKMAQEGMQFTNAFVTTSLCSPSRASFLTGQYMHNHKVVDNADLMRKGTITFPQILQTNGYETAFIGKWHMGGSSDAPRPGFDHWVSFLGQGTYQPEKQKINVNGERVARKKYMTDELTDYSIDWLAHQDKAKPFLLYLSHKGVHGLYDPAPRHRDRYKKASWRPPQTMANNSANRLDKPMWVLDQRNSWHGVEFPYHGRSGQSIEEMYKHYCEMILSIDESLAAVRKSLKEQGLEENTIIFFTSDGGHLWGEHGLIDKRCAYEESIRIPLLAFAPKYVAGGKRCDAIVSNIDLAPTVLELSHSSIPKEIDGVSFAPLLQEPENFSNTRKTFLYEYYWEPSFPQTPTTFALRDSNFKLIQYQGVYDIDELYDIKADPQETKNLIFQPAMQPIVKRMRKQLYEELKRTNGLAIPLGFKRNHGSNQRSPEGAKRAEFPDRMIAPAPE